MLDYSFGTQGKDVENTLAVTCDLTEKLCPKQYKPSNVIYIIYMVYIYHI